MRVHPVQDTPYFDVSASSESKLRMSAAGDELAPPRRHTAADVDNRCTRTIILAPLS